jgi:hypothetical protein
MRSAIPAPGGQTTCFAQLRDIASHGRIGSTKSANLYLAKELETVITALIPSL